MQKQNLHVVPNPLSCKDSNTVQYVHTQIQDLFCGRSAMETGRGGDYSSPMVLPAAWHPKHALEEIRSNVYYVTEKYDGVRYFLALLRYANRNFACMINRRGVVYPVSCIAPRTISTRAAVCLKASSCSTNRRTNKNFTCLT